MDHDNEKKYFELFALKILKEYQNLEMEKFIQAEKPDWQDLDSSIGIEITRNSVGTKFWSDLEKVKKPIIDIEEFNRKFKKNGGTIIPIEQARIIFNDKDIKDGFGFNDNYFYIIPSYNDDFSEINRIINKKLKKLNNNYKEMIDNRLFVFSPIYANEEMIKNELQSIVNIQEGMERKFDIVYVCLLNKLIVFNIKEDSWKCIKMDREIFDKLSLEASEEIKS